MIPLYFNFNHKRHADLWMQIAGRFINMNPADLWESCHQSSVTLRGIFRYINREQMHALNSHKMESDD
jgi:hypothetical protein